MTVMKGFRWIHISPWTMVGMIPAWRMSIPLSYAATAQPATVTQQFGSDFHHI